MQYLTFRWKGKDYRVKATNALYAEIESCVPFHLIAGPYGAGKYDQIPFARAAEAVSIVFRGASVEAAEFDTAQLRVAIMGRDKENKLMGLLQDLIVAYYGAGPEQAAKKNEQPAATP